MEHKKACLALVLAWVALSQAGCGGRNKPESLAHAVAVAPVVKAEKAAAVALPVVARNVNGSENPDDNAGLHDYWLDVETGEGVYSLPGKGQTVWVRLPIVHNNRVKATVDGVAAGRLRLALTGQVQALNGREVLVELPVKADKVFTLPFGCILSPRGMDTFVFVVEQGKAVKVPVKVLDMSGDTHVMVAGAFKAGQSVAVDGLDNLLEGDAVRVLGEEGK